MSSITSPDLRRRNPVGPLVAVFALALTVGLSACGSSGGSSKASGSGGSSSATTAAKGGGSGDSGGGTGSGGGAQATTGAKGGEGSGGSSGKEIKVCDLLTAADVAQSSGIPVTTAKAGLTAPGVSIASCDYETADEETGLDVSVSQSSALSAESMASDAETTKATKVAGVGDVAYYSSIEGEGLAVLYGNTEIDVTGLGMTQEASIKIAEALHAKL